MAWGSKETCIGTDQFVMCMQDCSGCAGRHFLTGKANIGHPKKHASGHPRDMQRFQQCVWMLNETIPQQSRVHSWDHLARPPLHVGFNLLFRVALVDGSCCEWKIVRDHLSSVVARETNVMFRP